MCKSGKLDMSIPADTDISKFIEARVQVERLWQDAIERVDRMQRSKPELQASRRAQGAASGLRSAGNAAAADRRWQPDGVRF
jgi:hypothetical protein